MLTCCEIFGFLAQVVLEWEQFLSCERLWPADQPTDKLTDWLSLECLDMVGI